jgi:hypothetical protein
MKRLLLLVFCAVAFPVMSKHIVGGEIELLWISGNTYRINLIYYLDVGSNPNRPNDPFDPVLGIFQKSNNILIQTKSLGFVSRTRVEYTQVECSTGGILTDKLIYSGTIVLSASVFNHPEGYYISWERCCRNYNAAGLLNIVSEEPPPGDNEFPRAAGQTFYIEFPPVVKNGLPFINSSPKLFPPLSDYGCINKPYYIDFAGTDVDDDSLVYSLVTPISTINAEAVPADGPRAGPYPLVQWRNPFDLNNIMGGSPDLKISEDGLLTVTPRLLGLFVFGVLAEEYRDGVKIGEVRRDFQMFVIDCPVANPPVILGKKLTDTQFTYKDNMSVSFSNTVSDQDRCIEVQVYDKDIHNSADNFMEKIKIRAIPIGMRPKPNVSGILPGITTAILTETDSVKTFRICFDECPYVEGPFTVGIIVGDDACALPLLDTIRVNVNIIPPPNKDARFINADITEVLDEGDPVRKWNIKAVDEDGTPMNLFMIADGVVLDDVGMKLSVQPQDGDTLRAEFTWDPKCDVYDFRTKTNFDIDLIVEDLDLCGFKHPDTLKLNLKINLPINNPPIIDSDVTSDLFERTLDTLKYRIYETVSFSVNGKDIIDSDFLVLGVKGLGFNAADYGIIFPGVTGQKSVVSPFEWTLQCDKFDLEQKDVFDLQFVVVDNGNKCKIYHADTLDAIVKVLPPLNISPEISMTNLLPGEVSFTNNTASIELGQKISIKLTGTDSDLAPQDHLTLELYDKEGNPSGYGFQPADGFRTVESVFSWEPDCSIFEEFNYETRDFENEYEFKFRVLDNRCVVGDNDTITLKVKIKDVDLTDTEFLPNNIITPNGDGCNDFFGMDGLEDVATNCGDGVNFPQLPRDNCTGTFLGIRIYNRWGRQVYASVNRNFRWYAENESVGIYYYFIEYNNKEYKGTVSVRH